MLQHDADVALPDLSRGRFGAGRDSFDSLAMLMAADLTRLGVSSIFGAIQNRDWRVLSIVCPEERGESPDEYAYMCEPLTGCFWSTAGSPCRFAALLFFPP